MLIVMKLDAPRADIDRVKEKIRTLGYIPHEIPGDHRMAIGITGILMRYFFKTDVVAVKELALGLVTLHPMIPATPISPLFYVHLFLVCVLFAYFPFSKLMHMGGIFLSPTRNLANTNRMRRHVNPWNAPVKVHTYEEWEDEFRDKMKAAGLPLEKG